jgi:hypothetical protein
MRPARSRGLSLIEVLISLFLLFIVSVYLLQLFAGGFRTFDRSLELTTATLLAQQKMEQELIYDVVQPATGSFSGAYGDYKYSVASTLVNDELTRVVVDVTGRHGVTAHLVTLKAGPVDFAGIGNDVTASNAVFRRQEGFVPDALSQNQASTTSGVFTVLAQLPANGKPAGVAMDPYASGAWVADRVNKAIWFSTLSGGTTWKGPYAPSAGLGTPGGVATDDQTCICWVADQTNKCLWYYRAADDSWRQIPAAIPPLGRLAGVATDSFASHAWVVDATNQCVRMWDDESKTWDPTQYGQGVLASPRGIAVPRAGQGLIYVVGKDTLYTIDTTTNSLAASRQIASGMVGSGLSSDPFGSTFWINDPNDDQGASLYYVAPNYVTRFAVP